VTDAARLEPHEHLAGARLGELELLDLERGSELLEHGGADLHADDPTGGKVLALRYPNRSLDFIQSDGGEACDGAQDARQQRKNTDDLRPRRDHSATDSAVHPRDYMAALRLR
jgi:hypothetical protein